MQSDGLAGDTATISGVAGGSIVADKTGVRRAYEPLGIVKHAETAWKVAELITTRSPCHDCV